MNRVAAKCGFFARICRSAVPSSLAVATIQEVPSYRARSTAPPPRRRPPPSAGSEALSVPLRLTVARGALGMELYEPLSLSAFEVSAFAFTLPGLRFPVDLSGGVAQFRHRRGELQHLVFRATPS